MKSSAADKMESHRRGLLVVVALGVLLLMAGVLVYRSQSVSQAEFALGQARTLLEAPTREKALQALPLLNEAAQLAPQMADVYIARSYAHTLAGDPEKAANDGSRAIELAPDDAWARINYGVALLDMRRPEDALKEFEKAVALEPENSLAHYNIGAANRQLKRYPEALSAYNKTLELEPELAEAHLGRGAALYHQGHYPVAFRAYSAAIRFGSGAIVTRAYGARGTASAKNGEHRKAIADYDTAILLAPKSASNFYNRGLSYKQLKNYRLALRDFNTAILLNPKSSKIYVSRAGLFAYRKLWRDAIADYSKALALNPDSDSVRAARAWAYSELGKGAEAERDCNYLIRKKRLLTSAYAYRGVAQILQFRDVKAEQDFSTARKLAKSDVVKTSNAAWKALERAAAKARIRRNTLQR